MTDIAFSAGPSTETLAEARGAWPWNCLLPTLGNALLCGFSDTSKDCPGDGRALPIRNCDDFFRAVAVANLMRANSGGRRLFGGGTRPAANSPTTRPLQDAVHVGNEYGRGRNADELSLSTAFSREAIQDIMRKKTD